MSKIYLAIYCSRDVGTRWSQSRIYSMASSRRRREIFRYDFPGFQILHILEEIVEVFDDTGPPLLLFHLVKSCTLHHALFHPRCPMRARVFVFCHRFATLKHEHPLSLHVRQTNSNVSRLRDIPNPRQRRILQL